MKKDTLALAAHLEDVMQGEPWFGRAVFTLLGEVDPSKVYTHPNNNEHSLIELLYHVITWASFTEQRILRNNEQDMKAFENMDWRKISPETHTWKGAVAELKSILKRIVVLLKEKDDSFLDEKVDYRDYDFRFLITGMTEHTIYHLGQIAYLNKFLS